MKISYRMCVDSHKHAEWIHTITLILSGMKRSRQKNGAIPTFRDKNDMKKKRLHTQANRQSILTSFSLSPSFTSFFIIIIIIMTQQTKKSRNAMTTGSSKYYHYTDRLLVLPHHDMHRSNNHNNHNHTTNNNSNDNPGQAVPKNNHKSRGGDLILLHCPFPIANLRGPNAAKLVANSKAASLVTSQASYALTVHGTSNTLVLWDPSDSIDTTTTSNNNHNNSKDNDAGNNNTNDDNHNDDNDTTPCQESPSKRPKIGTDTTTLSPPHVQLCRLLQAGGSGATILVGEAKTISPANVWKCLQQNVKPHLAWTTTRLAQRLLVSEFQILQALDELPAISYSSTPLNDTAVNDANAADDDSKDSILNGSTMDDRKENDKSAANPIYWHALSEANILLARAALIGVLCEGFLDGQGTIQETTGTTISQQQQLLRDQLVQQVAERLRLDNLLEDLPPKVDATAVAQKMVHLARQPLSTQSEASSSSAPNTPLSTNHMVVNPQTVSFAV